MRYYCITVRTGSQHLHSGERFYNGQSPLTIGQQSSSGIKLPCSDELLPQCFCVIVRDSQAGSWQLIRKSDFYAVRVNGAEVDCICNLADGDTIQAGECEFLFCEYNDDNYVESLGMRHVPHSRRWTQIALWCISAVLVLLASIFYQRYSREQSSFTSADNSSIRASVFKIAVTEILLQQQTCNDAAGTYRTVGRYEPDSISVGTCFFTADSLCVTARHCVEPWVDFSGWDDNTSLRDLPQSVCWAVLAEKSRLEGADTLFRIVSRCQVYDEDSCILEFTSDQCSFNRSRDIIARMGSEMLPWRIIYPLYSRKDVELGDFAFLKTTRRGELELATDDYLLSMDAEDETGIRIYGYPKTNHGNLWEHQNVSHVAVPATEDGRFCQCLQLNVSATSGYSGAPVIEKKDGRMMVVGIFSKIDDFVDSRNTFYAVPASEITQYDPKQANETKTYRR